MESQKSKFWLTEVNDGIYWLKLNRPEKKNAFNRELAEELHIILKRIESDETLRVLIITSVSDEYFSSGADIEWFYGLNEEEGKQVSVQVQEVFGMLEKIPIPVIFGVKGLNLTAGFELMIAADIIIAADNAQLGQIETKWALTPGGGGSQRLTRLVGVLKSRELIYTAKIISAAEALKIGLVNEVVPLNEMNANLIEIAKSICKKTRESIKDAKYIINNAYYPQEKGFLEEQKIFGKRFGSGEPRDAFTSFIKKMEK